MDGLESKPRPRGRRGELAQPFPRDTSKQVEWRVQQRPHLDGYEERRAHDRPPRWGLAGMKWVGPASGLDSCREDCSGRVFGMRKDFRRGAAG